jgi:GT2 family glycosyltransferase
MTAVIILNWNGWQDTIECIESLTKSTTSDFISVIVDNGSDDDSLEKIRAWLDTHNLEDEGNKSPLLTEFDREDIPKNIEDNVIGSSGELSRFILLINGENLGFAGGNNVGIRFALWRGFDKVLLLNNDTTVASDCMEKLLSFMGKNLEYDVVTPMICYYDKPDTIWNCGGHLTWWGGRKYLFGGQNVMDCPSDHQRISFITGCALMSQANVFRKHGLLTEQFFFGEEDYEFSLRMSRESVAMAAVLKARIFHKVSRAKESVFEDDALPSAFIHYLNRFIDLKGHYHPLYWKVWRIIYLGYIIPMLRVRHGIPIQRILKFSGLLLDYSIKKDSVTSEDFFQAKELFN